MDRRRFLWSAANGSIGHTVSVLDPRKTIGAASLPDHVMVKGTSAEKIIRADADALGGILLLLGAVLIFSNLAPTSSRAVASLLSFPLAAGSIISLLLSLNRWLLGKFR